MGGGEGHTPYPRRLEEIEISEITPNFANGVVADFGNRITDMNKEEHVFSALVVVDLVGWIQGYMWAEWEDDSALPKDRSPAPTIRDALQKFNTEQLVTMRTLVGEVNWSVTECSSMIRRDAKEILYVIDGVMVEK